MSAMTARIARPLPRSLPLALARRARSPSRRFRFVGTDFYTQMVAR